MKRVSFVLAIAALLGTPVLAQQTVTSVGDQATTTASQAQPPRPGQAQSSNSQADLDNVRLELTITDQASGGPAVKKVVSLLVAEFGMGRVRSGGEVYRPGTEAAPGSQYLPVTLNADANINDIKGDRIRARITVEYMPATTGNIANRMSQLNQTVDVVLTSGRSLMIVESADPTSDRKVSLHVTATIVR